MPTENNRHYPKPHRSDYWSDGYEVYAVSDTFTMELTSNHRESVNDVSLSLTKFNT